MTRIFLVAFALLIFIASNATAQFRQPDRSFEYGLKLQGAVAQDNFLPFWFYSNRRGTIDPDSPGGVGTVFFRKNIMDDASGLNYGFGVDFVSRYSDNSTYFFNQLYGRLSYGAFQFTGGRFFEQTGTVNQSLTMGSLAISENATPMFKVKLSIPEYTEVPLTRGFVETKGAIAHGWFDEDRVIADPWLHEKNLYFRFGGDFAFRPYIGLIQQVTWAGRSGTAGQIGNSFEDFYNVFFALSGTEDTPIGDQIYRQGDHRGIWDMGFYVDIGETKFKVYRQFLYDDKDGLKLRSPQDGLLGVSLELPGEGPRLVQSVLYEHLYSKYQRGPNCPGNDRGGAGGCENYYGNFFYRSGWTYFGNTIGNPLFLPAGTPEIDRASFDVGIINNRIVAHHIGIEGQFSSTLAYKMLATYSRNYGVYKGLSTIQNPGPTDFDDGPEQYSLLAKFSYSPADFRAVRFNTSLGADFGELYSTRLGLMLGIELLGFSSF